MLILFSSRAIFQQKVGDKGGENMIYYLMAGFARTKLL